MSLTLATLIPGLILLVLGTLLAVGNSAITAMFKAFPRSKAATVVFFGGGAAWFLFRVWNLSPADFGEYRNLLFIGFAAVAVLSFKLVPDFLAVRGLCVLVLLGASTLLEAAYGEYAHPQRLFMVSLVYLFIAAAIYLGGAPYRMRDFLDWLYRAPARARALGAALAVYGILLAGVSFSY